MFSLWRTNFLSLSLDFHHLRENNNTSTVVSLSIKSGKILRFEYTHLSKSQIISLLLSSKWFKITVFADKTNGAEGIIASATATMTSALPPTTKRLYVYVCIYRDETSFIINFLSLISLFFSENQRLSIRTRTKTPIWLITFGDDYTKGSHVLWCGSVRMRKSIWFHQSFCIGQKPLSL